ncbi:MAG: helix-turn-helix domain-containing protein [Oceanipulchritudo sp.]
MTEFLNKIPLLEWSRLRILLAWVREGGVGPRGHGRKHRRELNAAWLVLRGKVWASGDGWAAEAGKGQWLIPHPDPHEQYFSDDARILSVRFQATWPDGSYLWEKGLGLVVEAADYPDLEPCARRLLRLRKRHLPEAGAFSAYQTLANGHGFLHVQRELLVWLDAFSTALATRGVEPHIPVAGDERIFRAIEAIEARLGEPKCDVDAVAFTVGLSARQLDRIMLGYNGLTTHQFYQELRLATASDRLLQSLTPVKKIAYELGFSSPSHFSSWFQQRTGVTPRQFRNRGG